VTHTILLASADCLFLYPREASAAPAASFLSLTFQFQGAYVSPQAYQSQSCPTKDLVADAQTQAQKVVAAAGFAVGPIIAISDGSSSAAAVPTFAFRAGNFSTGTLYNTAAGFSPYAIPSACSIEVKFKLLRYQ